LDLILNINRRGISSVRFGINLTSHDTN